MTYNYSQIDKDNTKWFVNDNSRATLAYIKLVSGSIRRLTPFDLTFEYPISVLSGANGSGKSSVLALAACAFHNYDNGFCPPLRNKSYYTFQDFFVQSAGETPVHGVRIEYGIRHNNWRSLPPGLQMQARYKQERGKWNDYDTRVRRNVVYFGVQRVVPYYERTTHKSYRTRFAPGKLSQDTRTRIADIAGRIIGKSYSSFHSYEHAKYSLPFATSSGIVYSGFNMGAGESAIFEILIALFQSGTGSLLIIDEIELGLHELAQIRLISELKLLCHELKCQIISSTHSHAIIRTLPPEARNHIETVDGKTFITRGISADFACGKMGKPDSFELDIFVEDGIAKELLQSALPVEIRRRTRVKTIGSHSAVLRQMSSRYLEGVNSCVCILDGDQRAHENDSRNLIINSCEPSTQTKRDTVAAWASDRLMHLPGSDWPESWILRRAIEIVNDDANVDADKLVESWGLHSRYDLSEALSDSVSASKHNEFYELSRKTELSVEKVRTDIITLVVNSSRDQFSMLIQNISSHLP